MPRTSIEYEQAQQKRIVEGAARVFAENGYRLTTIDQIAQALQLSKGAVYIYFKSKEELYVAALAAIYERRFTILSTAYSENDRILVRFEKIPIALQASSTTTTTYISVCRWRGFWRAIVYPACK